MHLRDPARGIKAWHRVLELSPKSRTALDALARLYRAASKWRELAEVLGHYIPVLAASGLADDRDHACAVAMERAEILEQRLGAPADAIKVLDLLIQTLDPNHLDAHTSLRRLHEARGDFDAAVRVAEREMYLAPEPARKVARGLEIGLICRDRLANPTRALQAFKRVLELDPEQDEAMAAAADSALPARPLQGARPDDRAHARLQAAFEAPAEERRNLVQRIAQVTADKLGDPKGAFRWWRRAHEEAPDDNTLNDVRRAGEAYGLWRELADVLTDERKRLVAIGAGGVPDPDRYVALSRELSQLAERKLGDKPRAMTVAAEALAVTPRDASLLGELERLAGELDHRNAWKALADGFTSRSPRRRRPNASTCICAGRASSTSASATARARSPTCSPRSRGRATSARAGARSKARSPGMRRWRRGLRLRARRATTAARCWSALPPRRGRGTTHRCRQRADRAGDGDAAPRRAAAPQGEGDRGPAQGRAARVRSHLVALLLAPDDQDTASHAWRLGRAIGKYREVDRTPRPEPPPATIQSDQAYADAQAAASRATPGRPTQPRRVQTEPIADTELNLSVGDSTSRSTSTRSSSPTGAGGRWRERVTSRRPSARWRSPRTTCCV